MNVDHIEKLVICNDLASAARELESAFLDTSSGSADCVKFAKLCRAVGKRELAYKFLLRAQEHAPCDQDVLFEIALTQVDLSMLVDAYHNFSKLTEINEAASVFWQWRGKTATFLPRPEAPDPDTNVVTYCFRKAISLEAPSDWFVNEVLRFALNYPEVSADLISDLHNCADLLSPNSRSVLELYAGIASNLSIDFISSELFEAKCEGRFHVQALQRFCREIFIDPVIRNQTVSLRALQVFNCLAKLSDGKFGHELVRTDLHRHGNSLHDFVKKTYSTDTLVLVQTSSQYYSAFRLWYKLFGRLNLDYKLLVVALDGQAINLIVGDFPWLADRIFLFPIFPYTKQIYGDGHTQNFYWYQKNLIARSCLTAGYNIIQSDADAFWKKDVSSIFEYEFRHLDSDIVAQQEGGLPRAIASLWGFSLCAGFWGIRAGESSVAFIDQLLDHALYLWDDQVALNTLILNSQASWEGAVGGRCTTRLQLAGTDIKLTAVALPERVATRNIWDLDKVDRAVVHGQYFKHEEWVDRTVENNIVAMSDTAWGQFHFDAYRELATHLFQEGYHEAARYHLKRLLKNFPGHDDLVLQLGILSKILGEYVEAKDNFDLLISRNPKHVHGLMWSGLASIDLGEFDEALSRFDAALEADLSHVNGYIQKASLLERVGRVEEALQTLELGLVNTSGNSVIADHISRVLSSQL